MRSHAKPVGLALVLSALTLTGCAVSGADPAHYAAATASTPGYTASLLAYSSGVASPMASGDRLGGSAFTQRVLAMRGDPHAMTRFASVPTDSD